MRTFLFQDDALKSFLTSPPLCAGLGKTGRGICPIL
nr:MAG TPA: hypothetical protein [Caudoviricetes sp.]